MIMRIFITGASSGIGRELVKKLVKAGHQVWGVARRKELLESLKAESGGDFFSSQCDVSQPAEVEKVIKEMEEKNFLAETVILNAAILEEDLSPSFYKHAVTRKVLAVNLEGALIWVEKFLDKFLKRGKGHFIAVSSTSALRPLWASLAYPASKAGLAMAFRSLRIYYKKSNIKFSTVFFGPIATEISPGYLAASGWRKFFFVMTPKKAAQCLMKVIKTKKAVYYFPFFLTLIFRLTLFLPDSLFIGLSRHLKKKINFTAMP